MYIIKKLFLFYFCDTKRSEFFSHALFLSTFFLTASKIQLFENHNSKRR
jgi:hypothetical protein